MRKVNSIITQFLGWRERFIEDFNIKLESEDFNCAHSSTIETEASSNKIDTIRSDFSNDNEDFQLGPG